MEQGKPLGIVETSPDFAALCREARAALEPARVYAVSLHDEQGDVLWLTEGSMGPDEHDAVRQAFDAFAADEGPPIVTYELGASRCAVLFRAVNASRTLAGAIMLVMDTRSIPPGGQGIARLMTPKLRRVLSEFSEARRALRPAAAAAFAAAENPGELSLADSMRMRKPPAAPASGPAPAMGTDIDRLHAALRRSPIALHVQRLVPLTKGSRLKRYEVLLRSNAANVPNAAPQAMLKAAVEHGLGSMIDRRVVTELLGWLVRHPDVWRDQTAMFSVNLTSTALHDEHFIKFIELCLAKSSLPQAALAFEIDVTTAMQFKDRFAGAAGALHRLGCPLVLDDFDLRTECFGLLRLPGVRYVKLSAAMTAKMRADKLSQAAITAVVQMARVLGMHTVAKRTETAAETEWLTALGVDFIQSNALSPSMPIDSLAAHGNAAI